MADTPPPARRSAVLRALGWGLACGVLAAGTGPEPARIAAGALAGAFLGAAEAWWHNRKIGRQT